MIQSNGTGTKLCDLVEAGAVGNYLTCQETFK